MEEGNIIIIMFCWLLNYYFCHYIILIDFSVILRSIFHFEINSSINILIFIFIKLNNKTFST